MTAPIDFNAQREAIRAKIADNAAAQEAAENMLGELALDCQLGNAPQSELDAAQAEAARLQTNGDALTAALVEVDRRETAAAIAAAAKQRESDTARLAELQGTCDAAGVRVIDLAAKLGVVLAEGHAAAQEADTLGTQLDVSTVAIAQWPVTARQVIAARLGQPSSFLRPGEQGAAERSLAGQV